MPVPPSADKLKELLSTKEGGVSISMTLHSMIRGEAERCFLTPPLSIPEESMPFKRLTNGEPSVAFTAYETVTTYPPSLQTTKPTEDDRCDNCREFDKDVCPSCGPQTIAKVC